MKSNYTNNKIGLIAGAGMLLAFIVIVLSFTFSWFKTYQYTTDNYLDTKTLDIKVTGYNDKYYYNNGTSALDESISFIDFHKPANPSDPTLAQYSNEKFINYEFGTSFKVSSGVLYYCLENTDTWVSAGSVSVPDGSIVQAGSFATGSGSDTLQYVIYYDSANSTWKPLLVDGNIYQVPTLNYNVSKYTVKTQYNYIGNNDSALLADDYLQANVTYTKYISIYNYEDFSIKAYVSFLADVEKNVNKSNIHFSIYQYDFENNTFDYDLSTPEIDPVPSCINASDTIDATIDKIDRVILSDVLNEKTTPQLKSNEILYKIEYYSDVNVNKFKLSFNVNLGNNARDEYIANASNTDPITVYNSFDLKEVLSSTSLVPGQTIVLGDDITFVGDLVINRRVNINLYNYTLNIDGNLIYEFISTGKYSITCQGIGVLKVKYDMKLLTPFSTCEINGSATKGDIIVGGDLINGCREKLDSIDVVNGLVLNSVQILDNTEEQNKKNIEMLSDSKLYVGTNTTIGSVVITEPGVNNIKIINYGNILGVDLSRMDMPVGTIGCDPYEDDVMDRDNPNNYQIDIMNYKTIESSIVIDEDEYGVVLPSCSNPSNTHIYRASTSNTFVLKEEAFFKRTDIITDDVSTNVIKIGPGVYKVNVTDIVATDASVIEQYMNSYFASSGENISMVKSLEIVSLNDSVLTAADFSYLKNISTNNNLETLVLTNALLTDNTIPNNAFKDAVKLKSVVLPSNVTIVGNDAFKGTSIDLINIPSSLTYIGTDAFESCKAVYLLDTTTPYTTNFIEGFSEEAVFLVREVNLNSFRTQWATINQTKAKRVFSESYTTDYISYYYNGDRGMELCAFVGTINSDGTIEGTNGRTLNSYLESTLTGYSLTGYDNQEVKGIGPYAFSCVVNTTNFSIRFPDNLLFIKRYGFYDIDSLYAIDLNKVYRIDDYAFAECDNLRVAILSQNDEYDPSLSRAIGAYAFYNDRNLTNVEFHMTQSIGLNAFARCSSLEFLNMPNVVSIDSKAFEECSNIKIILLPKVTSIGMYAFNGASNVLYCDFADPSRTNLPSFSSYWNSGFNVKTKYLICMAEDYYDENSYSHAIALSLMDAAIQSQDLETSLLFPKGDMEGALTSNAQSYIEFVLNVIPFADGDSVGDNAGKGIRLLESSELDGTQTTKYSSYNVYNSENVHAIISYAHDEFEGVQTTVDNVINVTPSTYIVPSNYTHIYKYAYSYFASNRINPLYVDLSNVTYIGEHAFENNYGLVKLTANSVEEIDRAAFFDCTYLGSVNINSCNIIGTNAFYHCNNLKFINLGYNHAYSQDFNISTNFYSTTASYSPLKIFVKKADIEDYKSSFKLASNSNYDYDKYVYGILEETFIAGTSIYTYSVRSSGDDYLIVTDINEGIYFVNRLGESGNYYYELVLCNIYSNFNIIDGVTYDPYIYTTPESFTEYECTFLKDGSSVTNNTEMGFNIGDYKVKVIGRDSYRNIHFASNNANVAIILGSDVTRVDKYAFYNVKLSYIDFNNARNIGSYAFANTAISNTNNASLLEYVDSFAFYKCTALIEIDLSSATNINESAFEGCSNLVRVVLENVDLIGNKAFYNCYRLSDLNFSKTDIMSIVFGTDIISTDSNARLVRMFTKDDTDNERLKFILGNTYYRYIFTEGILVQVVNENLPSLRSNNLGNFYYRLIDGTFSYLDFNEIVRYKKVNNNNYIVSTGDDAYYVKSLNGSYIATYDDEGNLCSSGEYLQVGPNDYRYYEDVGLVDLYQKYDCAVSQYVLREIPNREFELEIETYIGTHYYDYYNEDGIYNVNLHNIFNGDDFGKFPVNYSVTEIGKYAFINTYGILVNNNSSNAGVLTIPDTVNVVYDYAFNGTGLGTINTNNVTEIKPYAFSNSNQLRNVSLDNVEIINNYAFTQDSALVNVTNVSNVTTIGDYAFYYCNRIAKIGGFDEDGKIHGFDNLVTIGKYAFYRCTALKTLIHGTYEYDDVNNTYVDNLISGITSIGDYAFTYSGVIDHELSDLNPDNDPDGIMDTIQGFDFRSIVRLGNYAFSYCSGLVNIKFNHLNEPGEYTFYNCNNLKFVDFSTNTSTNGVDYLVPAFTTLAAYWTSNAKYFVPYEAYGRYSNYLTNAFYRDGTVNNYDYKILNGFGTRYVEITGFNGVVSETNCNGEIIDGTDNPQMMNDFYFDDSDTVRAWTWEIPSTLTIPDPDNEGQYITLPVMAIGPSAFVNVTCQAHTVDGSSDDGHIRVVLPDDNREIKTKAFRGFGMSDIDLGGTRHIYEQSLSYCDYLVKLTAHHLRSVIYAFYGSESLRFMDFTDNRDDAGNLKAPDSWIVQSWFEDVVLSNITTIIKEEGQATVANYNKLGWFNGRVVAVDDNSVVFKYGSKNHCMYPTIIVTKDNDYRNQFGETVTGLKILYWFNPVNTTTETVGDDTYHRFTIPSTGLQLYNEYHDNIELSDEYKNLPIISIGNAAFYIGGVYYDDPEADIILTIPDSIYYIGDNAFRRSNYIKYIDIKRDDTRNRYNLNEIGSAAFYDCPSLVSSYGKSYLDLTGVSTIKSYGFAQDVNLVKVYYPNVTTLGSYAFEGDVSLVGAYKQASMDAVNNNLIDVDFVDLSGLTSLGEGVFRNDTAVKYAYFGDITSIPAYLFASSGYKSNIIYTDNGSSYSWDKEDTFNLRNITYIGKYAFNGCNDIGDFNTAYVTYIGEGAFGNCRNIRNITFEHVTYIGKSAFDGCINLEVMDFSNNIGNTGVLSCPEIYTFNRPGNTYIYTPLNNTSVLNSFVTYLPELECYIYEYGTYYEDVTTYPGYTVKYYYKETANNGVEIIYCFIPSDIRSTYRIPDYFEINGQNKPVVSIGRYAYYHNFSTNINGTIGYMTQNEFYLPTTVRSIGKSAFYKMNIGVDLSEITSIGDNAFAYNNKIIDLDLSKIRTIGAAAFDYNVNLKTLVLGTYLQSIGNYAFFGTTKLERIDLQKAINKSSAAPTLGRFAFGVWSNVSEGTMAYNSFDYYCNNQKKDRTNVNISDSVYERAVYNFRIYTDSISSKHYKEATNWKNYRNAITYEGIRLGDWVYTIYHNPITDCDEVKLISYENKNTLKLEIPSLFEVDEDHIYNVTALGENVFQNTTKLKEVIIPASIVSISSEAFLSNTSIERVKVDTHNTAFADDNCVLYNKNFSTLIYYPVNYPGNFYSVKDGTRLILDNAFNGNKNLEVVTIPASVNSIGSNVFIDCANLVQVNFLGDTAPKSMGTNVFPIYNANFAIALIDGTGAYASFTSSSEFGYYNPYYKTGFVYYVNPPVSGVGAGNFSTLSSIAIKGEKIKPIDVPWLDGYTGRWVIHNTNNDYEWINTNIIDASDLGDLASSTNTINAVYDLIYYKIYLTVGSYGEIENFEYNYYLTNSNEQYNSSLPFPTYTILDIVDENSYYVLPRPVRIGYAFNSWKPFGISSGNNYLNNNNGEYKINLSEAYNYGDVYLDAQYRNNAFTVHVNYTPSEITANGELRYPANSTFNRQSVTYDSFRNVNLGSPTLYGHVFKGFKLYYYADSTARINDDRTYIDTTVNDDLIISLSGSSYSLSIAQAQKYFLLQGIDPNESNDFHIYIEGEFEAVTYSINVYNNGVNQANLIASPSSLTEEFPYLRFTYQGFLDNNGNLIQVNDNYVTTIFLPNDYTRPAQLVNVNGELKDLSYYFSFNGWKYVTSSASSSITDLSIAYFIDRISATSNTATININASYVEDEFTIRYITYAYNKPTIEQQASGIVGVASQRASQYNLDRTLTFKMSDLYASNNDFINLASIPTAGFDYYYWYTSFGSYNYQNQDSSYNDLYSIDLEGDYFRSYSKTGYSGSHTITNFWIDKDDPSQTSVTYYSYMVAKSLTLTLEFTASGKSRINGDIDGHAIDNNNQIKISYTRLDDPITLPDIDENIIFSGYRFRGYYETNRYLGAAVTTFDPSSATTNPKFYANIEVISYDIQFSYLTFRVNSNIPTTTTSTGNVVNNNITSFSIETLIGANNCTWAEYFASGESSIEAYIAYKNGNLNSLIIPTLAGHTSEGFYSNGADCRSRSNQIDLSNITLSNLILFTRFDPIEYNISYHEDPNYPNYASTFRDKSTTANRKFDVSKENTFTLPTPELVNAKSFRFINWYAASDLSGEAITSLNTEIVSAGAIYENGVYTYHLYAKFEPIDYTISYVAQINNVATTIGTQTYNYTTPKDTLLSVQYRGYDVTLNGEQTIGTFGWSGNTFKATDLEYNNITATLHKFTVTFVIDSDIQSLVTNVTYTSTISNQDLFNDIVFTNDQVVTPITGYTFNGWYVEGSDTYYNGSIASGIFDSDVTLHASVTGINYNILYKYYEVKLDGAKDQLQNIVISNQNPTVHTFGVSYVLADASCVGYEFHGWYTSDDFDDSHKITSSISNLATTPGATVDIYAKFTITTYTITYMYVGSDGVTYTFDPDDLNNAVTLYDVKHHIDSLSVITLKDIVYSGIDIAGYTLTGWKYGSNSGDTIVSTTGRSEDLILFANLVPNTYVLSFDMNVDANAPTQAVPSSYNDLNVTFNSAVSLTGYAPTRIGYTFEGWYLDSNCTTPITTWTYAENKTVYAKWEEVEFTIKYLNNADKVYIRSDKSILGSISDVTYRFSDLVIPDVLNSGYTLYGYSLAGFNYNANANSEFNGSIQDLIIAIGDNATVVNVYAIWVANSHTVTFDQTDATTNGTASIDVTYGSPYNDITLPIRTGYHVLKYTYVDSPNGDTYFDRNNIVDRVWDIDADVTLELTWETNTYHINYISNVPSTTQSVVVGTMPNNEAHNYNDTLPFTLTINAYTLEGYKFEGWAESANGTKVYDDEHSIDQHLTTGEETIDLYAVWTPITYTITFYGNGYTDNSNENTPYTQSFTYDVTSTLIENHYSKTGYTFKGWSRTENAAINADIDFTDTHENIKNLANSQGDNIDLYAVWVKNGYTVVFHGNGNTSGSMEDQAFTYDEAQNLTANGFIKIGYSFKGWSRTENAAIDASIDYDDKKEVNNLTNVVNGTYDLYAVWTPNDYTVSFDRNDSTGSTIATNIELNITITYDATYPTRIAVPTRTGYTFGGYETSSHKLYFDANGDFVTTNSNVWKEAADTTLYAIWTAKNYTLTLNANNTGSTSVDLHDVATVSVTFDSNVISPAFSNATLPTKNGYTFNGFYADGNGTLFTGVNSNTYYIDHNGELTANWTIDSNATIYCKWTANKYYVVFNAVNPNQASSDVSGSMVSQEFTFDAASSPLTANAYTLTGWRFNGWIDSENNTYDDGDSVQNLAYSGDFNLYTTWVQNTYTVTYNKNTGSGSDMASSTLTYDDEDVSLRTNTYTKVGYTFDHWNTASDNSGQTFADGAVKPNVTSTHDTTIELFAIWKKNGYKVVFHGNGNTSGSMEEQSFTYDEAQNLTANGFIKTGYSFKGWSTTENAAIDANIDYSNSKSVSNLTSVVNGTYDLYAVWTKNFYTVTLDGNKGSGSSNVTQSVSSLLFEYDSTTMKTVGEGSHEINSITIPSRDGYTFEGYYANANGTGTQYIDNSGARVNNWTIANNTTTIYAKWTANTYTVEYNANKPTAASANVSGSTDTSTHTYDVSKALTANGYSLIGWTFAGWNTEADGSGTPYDNNASVSNLSSTDGATVTLYAQWTENKYNIVFNNNSGQYPGSHSGSTEGISNIPYESSVTLTANGFALTGYTFAGWSTSANKVKVYDDEATVSKLNATNGATVTLYAIWTANQYTVKFNGNGNTNTDISMDDQVIVYDSNTALTQNVFTKTGYTFLGWSEDSSATTATYTDKQAKANIRSDDGATVTLYAVWKVNTYKIIFNMNSIATTSPASYSDLSVDYDTSYNISSYTPTRTGYVFGGWYEEAECTNAFNNSATWNYTSNKIVYAKWTANTYTVVFNENQPAGTTQIVSGTMANQGFTYDEASKALTTNAYTLTGYTFKGWSKTQNAALDSAIDYTNAQLVTNLTSDVNGTVNLYAVWQLDTYTISYDLAGGSASNPETYNVNTATFTLSNPTRTGYTFAGWTGTDSGMTVTISQGSTGNRSYTATWTAHTYTIEFDANRPDNATDTISETMASQDFTYGTSQALSTNLFTLDGWTFKGWAESASGAKVYNDGHSFTTLTPVDQGKVTLFAVWEANTYTITLDRNEGSGGATSVTATYDSPLPNINVPTRTGYVFGGYYYNATKYINADGTSAISKYGLTDAITLVASWTPITYYVRFNANNGTGEAMANQQFTYDVLDTLNDCTYTRSGYKFSLWNSQADGQGTDYLALKAINANLSSTDGDIVDLYAIWDPIDYSISYDLAGGSVSSANPTSYNIESNNITLTNPTREGYTFAGWTGTDLANATTTVTISTGSIGNRSYTATWTANTYYVRFNSNIPSNATNGITGSMSNQSFTYDANATALSTNQFDLVGWTFKGWATSAGGIKVYDDKDEVQNLSSTNNDIVDLYAVWEATIVDYVITVGFEIVPNYYEYGGNAQQIDLDTNLGANFVNYISVYASSSDTNLVNNANVVACFATTGSDYSYEFTYKVHYDDYVVIVYDNMLKGKDQNSAITDIYYIVDDDIVDRATDYNYSSIIYSLVTFDLLYYDGNDFVGFETVIKGQDGSIGAATALSDGCVWLTKSGDKSYTQVTEDRDLYKQ